MAGQIKNMIRNITKWLDDNSLTAASDLICIPNPNAFVDNKTLIILIFKENEC